MFVSLPLPEPTSKTRDPGVRKLTALFNAHTLQKASVIRESSKKCLKNYFLLHVRRANCSAIIQTICASTIQI